MINYFIYAYSSRYGGLHGMYRYDFVTCENFEEACEYAYELAGEVVDFYLRTEEIYSKKDYMNDVYNGEEWDDRYYEDYWYYFEEMRQEECAYEVYQIKEGVTEEDFRNWDKKNMGPKDFIKHYCLPWTVEEINI